MKKSPQGMERRTRGRGTGNDVYVFNLGDGVDHIVDSNANGQINTLRFGDGIRVTDIVLGVGSLMLDLGPSTGSGQVRDVIHIDNFDPNDAANSSSIQQFEFADGSTCSDQAFSGCKAANDNHDQPFLERIAA